MDLVMESFEGEEENFELYVMSKRKPVEVLKDRSAMMTVRSV